MPRFAVVRVPLGVGDKPNLLTLRNALMRLSPLAESVEVVGEDDITPEIVADFGGMGGPVKVVEHVPTHKPPVRVRGRRLVEPRGNPR